MYGKKDELTPDQYQGGTKTWNSKPKFGASKEKTIKAAMDRKDKSIKAFTDAKSMQIAVSSAFNGAAEIVNILLGQGKVDPDEYWEAHTEWYDKYLSLYLRKQEDAREESSNASAPSKDYFSEAKEYAGIDSAVASQEEAKELI